MEGPKNAQVEPRTPMFLMKKDESELDKDLYSGSSSKNQKSSVGTKSATGNNNNKERKPGALRSTADPSARTGFGKIASKPKVPTVPEKLKGPSKHMRSLIPLNEEGKPRPMISNASIDALANVVATDEKWKSFEEKIKKGLAKAGEYPTQSALMNLIFPFEFAQTEVYAKLQGKFRINELTDLLRRVINYVSDKKPITIMAYEAQFIDEHSWELIWDLCNSCPKLMFNIYSRPEQHYRNMEARHSYMKFKKHANCQFISLSGLSFDDTESLLIRSWTTHTPVKSVAKSVAQSVHQRTEGNPMHVKSMIGALKESGYFGVEGGELKIVKSGFDFEKSISLTDNLKTTVTSQLDRIGSNFQLFLKVASVLGQPFLLMDTLVLLQDTPGFNEMFEIGLDENAIADKIKHMDKYEYLTRTDNVTMGVMLQFKSSLVRNCVYSSMLVAQRQQLHLNVACYYEEIINASNQQRLFLSLYEHYTEAEESYLDKRLTYLEILAHIYFEKRSIGEAVNHYLLLIDLSQKNPTIFFDEASKSTWHRELGESYFSQGLEALAEKHLLESLKIAGSPFPSNYLWLSWKLESERRIRASFPILLAGDADLSSGVSKMPDADPKEVGSSTDSLSKFESGTNFDAKKNVITEEMRFDPMALQLEVMLQDRDLISEHNVRRALSCLAIIYLNTGKLKRHAYAVHAGTNVSEIFPRDAIYAKFMAMSGELGWITGGKKRTTLRYIESATKHDQRFDLHTTVSIVLKSALTFFFMGKWGSAIRRLGTLPALEMMSGDFSIRIDALRMRSLVVHFCGVAPQSLKAAKSLYLISNREDNWLGKLWGCELILANFINSTKTQGEVQLYANNLKNLWLDVPEKEKTDPILCLNYTALIAKAAVRMAPQTFSLDEFVKSMLKISNEINRPVPAKISENLCNTRGGESNSISGPHSWLSILGILHSLNVMLLAYDTGLINSSSQKNSLRKICNELEKFLTRGVFMKQMTISEPVALLVRGVGLQISSRGGATKAWKKALACRRVSDLMYVRGLLHLYIACYTDNPSDSNHNAHESQKIFSRIGATVDFERAKSFRKDKKGGGKKSRASAASGTESDAEPRELDENNMGYSMFDENQSHNSGSVGE